MDCGRKRYGTGQIFPSSSVLFTGELPQFISADDVPCDANLDEIIKEMNDKLQDLLDSNDFTELDKKCLDFNPETVKAKELHQKEIDKICSIDAQLSQLIQDVDNLNIGSQHITIDLKCLKPEGDPCEISQDTYTLLSVLNILVNEICLLKQ